MLLSFFHHSTCFLFLSVITPAIRFFSVIVHTTWHANCLFSDSMIACTITEKKTDNIYYHGKKRQITCAITTKRQIICAVTAKRQIARTIKEKRQIACAITEKKTDNMCYHEKKNNSLCYQGEHTFYFLSFLK